jgi:hypothetical protein
MELELTEQELTEKAEQMTMPDILPCLIIKFNPRSAASRAIAPARDK